MRLFTFTLHPGVDRVVRVARLIPGATSDARLQALIPAGKGVNTARVLRALARTDVHAVAWLGEDQEQFFASFLRRQGISTRLCLRAAPTRMNLTVVEADGRETHWRDAVAQPTRAEMRALLKMLKALPLHGATVAFCGSAPPKTPRVFLKAVFEILRARAKYLMADTYGPCLEAAASVGADLLKGNAAEIAAWLGLPEGTFHLDRVASRRALASACAKTVTPDARPLRTVRVILVTLGAQGAVLGCGGRLWHAPPPKLPPGAGRFFTGCGDAATAGWLWAHGQGRAPEDCLRAAVACGTAKLLAADPGKVNPKVVRQLLKRTQVKELPA